MNYLPIIKKYALLLCILFFAIQSHAQQQVVGKLSQAMTDSLAYLQLTDQQKKDALALNQTAATSLLQLAKKAKEDTTFKGKALVQQVMGVMKTRNGGLTKMLTPDQQQLYQQHKIEQLADLQTKLMSAQLDLTEQQQPQVYALNLKETAELMKDAAKLQSSKRKLQKFKAAKALKGDSADKDKALKGILSENQYAIYEKNKEAMQAAMKEKMQEKKKG